MKTSMRNLLLNLAAIGLLALFLVWAETNLDGYKVQILNLIAVNAILALSLNLIYGFTGMFSLGHAGFMAIGAYVSALCVLPAAQKEMMWILEDIIWPFSVIHTPFWFSVVAGGWPRSSGCSSPSPCCGSAATTSASPRWGSRRSSACSS